MQDYWSTVLFALALSISPGPVNMITLSSGVRRGLAGTLPFVLGASLGFTALLFLLGLGLLELVTQYDALMTVIKTLGTAYICYLAFLLFKSPSSLAASNQGRAPRFYQGVLLQWLNPKAWAACLTGLTFFTTAQQPESLYTFCTIYLVVCICSIGFWAVLGSKSTRLLSTEYRQGLFNKAMSFAAPAVGGSQLSCHKRSLIKITCLQVCFENRRIKRTTGDMRQQFIRVHG